MTRIMPDVPLADLRQRLDLDATAATDEQLDAVLEAATVIVANELPGGDFSTAENVREAVAQIAVKVWDLRPRGFVDPDGSGGYQPVIPATAGLVRSVRGLLLPSMPAGGLTA
jgi:hypothetical protein